MTAIAILSRLNAAGVRVSRRGSNLLAQPKAAVTHAVLVILRAHKAELLTALVDECANDANHCPAAITNAPEQRNRRTVCDVSDDELLTLVDAVAIHYDFNDVEHDEAKARALADPIAALECFRLLSAGVTVSKPLPDHRVRCSDCINLAAGRCTRWREQQAQSGWQPVDRPINCQYFKRRSVH
jgi:hypothetical protein